MMDVREVERLIHESLGVKGKAALLAELRAVYYKLPRFPSLEEFCEAALKFACVLHSATVKGGGFQAETSELLVRLIGASNSTIFHREQLGLRNLTGGVIGAASRVGRASEPPESVQRDDEDLIELKEPPPGLDLTDHVALGAVINKAVEVLERIDRTLGSMRGAKGVGA